MMPAYNVRRSNYEVQKTYHFDSTAETNLTITLAKMKVSNRKLGSRNMNGEIRL